MIGVMIYQLWMIDIKFMDDIPIMNNLSLHYLRHAHQEYLVCSAQQAFVEENEVIFMTTELSKLKIKIRCAISNAVPCCYHCC